MSTVGILPVGGLGTRLGLPFPKALAPTFTQAGIQPLYTHAYDRLRVVCDRIVFVDAGERDDWPGEIVHAERAGLAAAVRAGAKGLRPDDLCAVALPDTLWWPERGMRLLVNAYRVSQPCDGVLATWDGSSHNLDEVVLAQDGTVSAVRLHANPPEQPRRVRGWGAFVASAGCLRGLDDGPLGPQLAEYRFIAEHFGDEFYDLGDPKRYRHFIDLPLRREEPS